MPFFARRGHPIMIGAYYDAKDLTSSVEWAKVALDTPGVKGGIMYCTWCDKWDLLGAFGDEMKRLSLLHHCSKNGIIPSETMIKGGDIETEEVKKP